MSKRKKQEKLAQQLTLAILKQVGTVEREKLADAVAELLEVETLAETIVEMSKLDKIEFGIDQAGEIIVRTKEGA